MTDEPLRFVFGDRAGIGLVTGTPAVGWRVARRQRSRQVQELYVAPASGRLYAGTRGSGAFTSDDGGETWHALAGLEEPIVRSFLAGPDLLLVGTEPARLFRRAPGGGSWEESRSFRQVPGAEDWFTPYSDHAGATRALAADPHRDGRALAGIEVGGFLESPGAGRAWRRTGDGIHQDVHQLEPDPAVPGRLFAATAGGLFRSLDGGGTWRHISSGMDGQYTRAVTVHPEGEDRLLTAVSPQVGGAVRLYASDDGGESWDEVAWDLPGRTAFINRFTWGGDGAVYALTTRGQWLRGPRDLEGAWRLWDLELDASPWGAVALPA